MINRILIVLNFIGQVPMEDIRFFGVKAHPIDGFGVGLRFTQIILLYGFYYFFLKCFQLVLSYLMNVEMQDISIFYLTVPALFFMEIGLSKLNSANPINILKFTLRSLAKSLLLYAIDSFLLFILD